MEARVTVLEQIARTTAASLDRIERRMDALEHGLRSELHEIRTEMRADFRWLLGIMLGGLAGLLGVMAHGFHWL